MQPSAEKTAEEQQTSQSANPIEAGSVISPDLGVENSAVPPTPPQQNPSAPLPIDPPKKSKKKWLMLVLLVLIIAAAIVPIFLLTLKDKNEPTSTKAVVAPVSIPVAKAHLIFADSSSKTVTVTGGNAKKEYSFTYDQHQYITLLSTDSKGNSLFITSESVSIPDPGYVLVDSKGNQKKLSDTVVAALRTTHKNGGDVLLETANAALMTNCEYQEKTKNSECKIIDLNLTDGSSKTLLDIKDSVPPRPGDTSPLFDLVQFSKDKQSVYMKVAGPTDLGKSELAFYELNLQSNKTTLMYELPSTVFAAEHATLSPDGKKVVYLLSTNGQLVLHSVDLDSQQDAPITWKKDEGAGYNIDPAMWQWSPDGVKVLLSEYKPAMIAYLDLSKKAVTDLVKIEDTDHYDTYHKGWIDNKTIAYAYNYSASANDFRKSQAQVNKMDITAKTPSKFASPTGYFAGAVNY
jgi:hypothetical protein